MNACKICGNASGNRTHVAREMMFGLRDPFTYLECGRCGCLQLIDIPTDLGRYYPKSYYSYQQQGGLRSFVRHRCSAYNMGARSLLGWFVCNYVMVNTAMVLVDTSMKAVRRVGSSRQDRVLDVGCGSGRLLLDLKNLGFASLSGVDPFLERDLVHDGGPAIYKRQLSEMEGPFDLVMLHHSFEHMDHPADILRDIERLLAPGGKVILRIPVACSYAWRHYGVNWVHLDAPRHLYLHTSESIRLLANRAGLKILDIVQEGDEGTLWASEAYARDIAMHETRSPVSNPFKKLLSPIRLLRYRALTREINRRSEADLVCLVLSRVAPSTQSGGQP